MEILKIKVGKKIFFKITTFFLLVILTSLFLWNYFNRYLTRSKATASNAILSLRPSTTNFSLNQEITFNLILQFNGGSSSEKVDYFKTVINFPKENLNLSDVINTNSSGLTYQFRVDGQVVANETGQIVIEIGASSSGSGPSTNSVITLATMKFKAIAPISSKAQISIGDSQIVNNNSSEITINQKNGVNFTVSSSFDRTFTFGVDRTSSSSGDVITSPPNSPPPSVTTSPTQTPSTNNLIFSLLIKFQGISSKPKDQYSKMKVKVTLKYANGQIVDNKKEVDLTVNENGIWRGNITFENVDTSRKFRIYIKGPKHLQKKICSLTPEETYPGSYYCSEAFEIPQLLKEGSNNINLNLDARKIVLLVGDIDQDGIVSAYDISFVRNNLGKKDEKTLKLADFNLDGIIDSQDYSLIIAALSVKSDEE